mmetsp:Transcript_35627/g.42902  ORF Transcript_35627/g.42902 Transcript_35627/m.42902 type:complete len:271 (+) Transcript_35627:286-1098(+)|eukprot:CAMPEP_0197849566 /NCGR_PEP_ID=MMETSP1438-20131217/12584_1 /TAXON_ID=1461541 /ORGANISM="Pterosperma sp., Strain CCMP1384" /LENGTH=270 /DNA_ID=CAMNT_0043462319 /DNA_START=267 /DNA_END=1079 /DNA_ORIENTATION=-
MSFADAYDDGVDIPDNRAENGLEECTALASVVFQLTTHISSFKRLADTLGTTKDTHQLRNRLAVSRDAIGQMARETSTRLKELSDRSKAGELTASVHASHQKILRDFQSILKEFQKAQRVCSERESIYAPQEPPASRKSTARADGGSSAGDDEGAALLAESRVELVQVDNEIEYNSAIIQEREEGIQEIQQQITEVNEIFQDLAVLVNEQGSMVDDIEANIVKTNTRTKDAHSQLLKADKSQKTSRNRMCYLMTFFIVVFVVLILVLLNN